MAVGMGKKITLLLVLFVAANFMAAAQHTRIAKPLKKIHTDTIAIPDDMFFFTEEPAPEEAPKEKKPKKEKKKKNKQKKDASNRSENRSVAIIGDTEVDVETMVRFVRSRNADFPREIAEAFHRIGKRYGIRGDIALCQSIIETGWFKFTGGTAVTLDQNNFCGLGVTKLGIKGHSFSTVDEGVTAQIQHLFAYACKHSLPRGEKIVDPRFKLVSRGIAPTWHDLNNRWAANSKYGDHILALFDEMRQYSE